MESDRGDQGSIDYLTPRPRSTTFKEVIFYRVYEDFYYAIQMDNSFRYNNRHSRIGHIYTALRKRYVS
ncbi:unnamed protein product [Bursaphelenchus okinawaensis]|uniref:Uncharacterized protein n=1 Tax=Bursaphelenchus okinawaensis TaxID=465554 RepID=A0A811LI94_9BILA|nr:unnamed protein product [Bursaphelenchus okinawaensis]CAG9123739.1 unnamed protein product [Bursaphelenchus okinawaensis]